MGLFHFLYTMENSQEIEKLSSLIKEENTRIENLLEDMSKEIVRLNDKVNLLEQQVLVLSKENGTINSK